MGCAFLIHYVIEQLLNERANGTRYREIEFALPNELSTIQQKEIIDKFIENHLKDFYYAYAIHDKIGSMSNGQRNTHVHIMFSEHEIDAVEKIHERPEGLFFRPAARKKNPALGGAPKAEKWIGKYRAKYLCEMRRDFASIQNAVLEKYGFDIRVDHRSLTAQRESALANGDSELAQLLDRIPEQHVGPSFAADPSHQKVVDLAAYRQSKYEYKKLLLAAAMLEDKMSKEAVATSANSAEKIAHSEFFKYASSSTASKEIRKIKEQVIHSMNEINALRSIAIWNSQALQMAKLKFMTQSEKELFQKIQSLSNQRDEILANKKNLPTAGQWNSNDQKAYQELLAGFDSRQKQLENVLKKLGEAFKPVSERLHREHEDAINSEAQTIMQNDKPTKDRLKKYSRQLEQDTHALHEAVLKVSQTALDQAIQNARSVSYTATEIAKILRIEYSALKKEYDSVHDKLVHLNAHSISSERAQEIALDIYAKHGFKELRAQKLSLGKESKRIDAAKLELENAKKSFSQMNKPGFFSGNKVRVAYTAAKENIIDLQNKISSREANYMQALRNCNKQYQQLLRNCNTPDAKEKISAIAAGILKKNQSINDQIQPLMMTKATIKMQINKNQNLQKSVKQQVKYDAQTTKGKARYKIAQNAKNADVATAFKTTEGSFVPSGSAGDNHHHVASSIIAEAIGGNVPLAHLVARLDDKDVGERSYENSEIKSRAEGSV